MDARKKMRGEGWVLTGVVSAALCFALPVRAVAQDQTLNFEAAARQAPRLAPAAFPNLPGPVAAALRENGCTVPQYRYEGDTLANNLIRGEFARAGQIDHAALCSRNGRTSLLVVWGGPARCAATTKESLDVDAMVGAGEEIVYSRRIERMISRQAEDFAWLAGAEARPTDHDGILHTIGEYQTSFLYCQAGRWVEIAPNATT